VSEHLDFLTNLLLCPTSWCSLYKSSVGGGGKRRPSPEQEPRFQGSSGITKCSSAGIGSEKRILDVAVLPLSKNVEAEL